MRFALSALSLIALSSTAFAAPALGLTGEKTLVWFDTDKPAEAKKIEVTGIDRLLGIDLRPADKMVYGVAGDGQLVTINLETGAATAVSKLDAMLPDGVKASVDFNPMADKLRVMGSDGTNLRVDPASGKVTQGRVSGLRVGRPERGDEAQCHCDRLYQFLRQAGKDGDVRYRRVGPLPSADQAQRRNAEDHRQAGRRAGRHYRL